MKRKVNLVRPERKLQPLLTSSKATTAEQVVEKKSVDELVLLAGLLNPSQQKELLARLSLTNQTLASGEVRDVDMWATALHDSLVSSVGGSGEGVAGPAVIKRLVASPSAWGPVSSFMKASTLAELNVTERQAAYMMLARLVIDNARGVAKHSRIPLTTKMVINCSSNITGIFQQSFPGYIESGLAKLVVRRMNAH